MSPTALATLPFQRWRQFVRSFRNVAADRSLPLFRPRDVVRGAWSSSAIAKALRADGICILERVIDPAKMAALQKSFEGLVATCAPGQPGPEDVPNAKSALIDFRRDPLFLEIILDELIAAAIEAYYGRPISLVLSMAQRLEPSDLYEGKAYQWHHDTKGKYVKAMWLLTDVPSDGQRMSFVCGSHTMTHRWTTYEQTRFSDAYARRRGRVLECTAPAGSVIVFDTNGIHRGNHNAGQRRDVVVGAYSTGRYRLGCQVDDRRLGHLSDWQRRIVKRSLRAST